MNATARSLKVGINPIVWINDDFHDLGGDTALEVCLEDTHACGYEGIELGRKFPREPSRLHEVLRAHELRLVSGWHSLYLLDAPFASERACFQKHLDLLIELGSPVAIVAECSRRTYPNPTAPLEYPSHENDHLDDSDWQRLAEGLESLAELTRAQGLRLVYHPHMGTVVQSEAEIDALMARTKSLDLLFDTGHLCFAGADPLAVLAKHLGRVGHVHLKDVRDEVIMRARAERYSFSKAVRSGVFTVPGDGSIDYRPIFRLLETAGYSGWIVVEAEQDPALAPPKRYAEIARRYLREVAGV
jgi:myo-inosose-2 dehydratase